MKVTEVQIHNVLGIRERTIKPGGTLTEFRGKNGTGKTSALEALKAALGGGDIATLAHVGAEGSPEIVLVLDDGTRVRRKGKGATVEVAVDTSAGTAYAAIKKPQAFLDGLFDTRLSNPVRLLTASKDERREIVLEALPLELDLAALWDALPPAGRAALEAVDVKGHPLQVLAAARQRVYELRTDINRTAKEKAASADQLKASLPTDGDRDYAADIAALENEHRALDEVRRARLAEAQAVESRMLAGLEESRRLAIETVKNGQEAAAAKLRSDRDAKLEAIRKEYEAAAAELAKGAAEALETINTESDAAKKAAAEIRHDAEEAVRVTEPELQRLSAELATARTKAQEAGRVAATREMAEKFAREAAGFQAHAEDLSAAIKTLDEAKDALAKNLPIPGLAIEGRDITVGGVLYDQLNKQGRVDFAVDLSTIRARDQKLKCVFLDEIEALDTEHRTLLFKRLETAGIQAFVAEVTDTDFEVRTSPAEVVTA